jgi:small subunit ribosomal protein S21
LSRDDGAKGIAVEVRNGDFNKALRLFKKKVQESGILEDLRAREFYEKPTAKRKKAKAAAKARWKKQLRSQQLPPKNY